MHLYTESEQRCKPLMGINADIDIELPEDLSSGLRH